MGCQGFIDVSIKVQECKVFSSHVVFGHRPLCVWVTTRSTPYIIAWIYNLSSKVNLYILLCNLGAIIILVQDVVSIRALVSHLGPPGILCSLSTLKWPFFLTININRNQK